MRAPDTLHLVLSAILVSFVAAAAPLVEIEGVAGCVDRVELERELHALVPVTESTPRLTLLPGEVATIVVELRNADDDVLLRRVLPAAPEDCRDLPRAIARVVERRLRVLGDEQARDDDDATDDPDDDGGDAAPSAPPITAPRALPVRDRARPRLTDDDGEARPVAAIEGEVDVTLRASLGGAIGVVPWGGDGRLELAAVLGGDDGAFGAGLGSLRVEAPVAVGSGAALAGSALFGGSLGYAWRFGPVTAAPEASAAVGITAAQGLGFERPHSVLFPMAVASAALRVEAPSGLSFALGAEVPLVHVVLTETGAPRGTELPRARLFGTVGARFDPWGTPRRSR